MKSAEGLRGLTPPLALFRVAIVLTEIDLGW